MAFLPFVVNVRFGHHPLEPLWSIGVEEIFYLLWAPLVSFCGKHMTILLSGVIALKLAALVYVEQTAASATGVRIVRMLQFEALAAGGLGACWVNAGMPLRRYVLARKTVPLLLLALFVLLCVRSRLPDAPWSRALFGDGISAVAFQVTLALWLLLSVAVGPSFRVLHESRTLDALGLCARDRRHDRRERALSKHRS